MNDAQAIVLKALQEATGQMTEPETLAALERGEDVSFENMVFDSLDRFEAMMMIEEALDIELDDDEVMAQRSFLALSAFVAQKAATGAHAG
ncbi:MAG: acyl carrier protein [Pseudomonadota bacterium]